VPFTIEVYAIMPLLQTLKSPLISSLLLFSFAFMPLWGPPALAQTGDERILAAREALQKGDRARLEALAAQGENHVLDAYVTYWLWVNRLARPEAPNEAELNAYFAQEPQGFLTERLKGQWLLRLARDRQWAKAKRVFHELKRPDQEQRCLGWQSSLHTGEKESVFAQTRGLWLTLIDSPAVCDPVLKALFDAGRVPTEEVWWRFRHQMDSRTPEAALTTLAFLNPAQAPSRAAVQAMIKNPKPTLEKWKPENAKNKGQRELALSAIARLARSDVQAAHAHFSRIHDAFSPDEQAYAWTALGHRAATSHLPTALEWYARAGHSLMTEEQRAWQVRAALRVQNWSRVRQSIEAMPTEQRKEPEWIYWLGRAQGSPSQAQTLYREIAGQPHFYGMLAAEELGRLFIPGRRDAPLSQTDERRAREHPGLRRALALYALDLRTEAVREWIWAMRDQDAGFYVAASRIALENELYDRAINTAELGNPDENYDIRYLSPFRELVEPKARELGLDMGWIYGIMRQESRFVGVARSHVGAQGLMQVMPATGKWVAKKIGRTDYDPSWLTRLDTNVLLGTHYMNLILAELEHHPVLASAGYNAGPGRARRWRDSRALEGAIYAETIPFDETRDYVKKVLANAVVYAALFEKKPQSLKARLGVVGPRP
jgi:soluble lytic murein transglycosylase